ncbi:MAG: WbuC family cupin fold metalloprotein [Syntrophobacteraceae bacterium]|nr:WbuC family cupin fold metalloprotein [Syntrophobacteraceae bacterium]
MKSPEIMRISPLATRSCHEMLLLVDKALIDRKACDAAASGRKREIHALHSGDEDTLHRMLNAIQPGSYIRPHRHLNPPKAETIVILQGSLGYVPFEGDSTPVDERFILLDAGRGAFAVDSRAGLWHTFFALEENTVLLEVKPGPYEPGTDKDFAPWAPAENEDGAPQYLMSIEDRFRSVCGLPRRPWGS